MAFEQRRRGRRRQCVCRWSSGRPTDAVSAVVRLQRVRRAGLPGAVPVRSRFLHGHRGPSASRLGPLLPGRSQVARQERGDPRRRSRSAGRCCRGLDAEWNDHGRHRNGDPHCHRGRHPRAESGRRCRRVRSASACWQSAGPGPLHRVREKRAPGERPGGKREVVSLTQAGHGKQQRRPQPCSVPITTSKKP